VTAWYPWIRLPAGRGAVLEATAGAVLADEALTALSDWLRDRPGVRLHPHRRVVDVDETTGRVTCSDATVLAGDRVVVAAGPWSRDLIPAEVGAGLTLYRQSVLSYLPARMPKAWTGAPATLGLGADLDGWLMPQVAGAPARLSSASACREVPEMTDRVTPPHWRDLLIDLFRVVLPDFDPGAVVGTTDGYYLTETASGGPLLTSYGDGTVWAYAACGGRSFKLAPLVASSIAERVVRAEPPAAETRHAVDQPRQLTRSVGSEP
jgi:glycine/D-amino acid oxidase-like deaminating enzyme